MNNNTLTRVAETLARREAALLDMRVCAPALCPVGRAGLPIARAYVNVPPPLRVRW